MTTPTLTPTETVDQEQDQNQNQNEIQQQEEEEVEDQLQLQPQPQPQPQPEPEQEEDLNPQPQSPKTLTLDSPEPQQNPPISLEDDQTQDDPDFIPPLSPPITDSHVITTNTITTSTTTRRNPPKRKNKKMLNKKRVAQEKKSKKKLESLIENLKPIPFVPIKTLDFSHHETLLKRLDLWDFVHLDLDRNLRTDLLAQLIATFTPSSRCSYVNGVRIGVNRADLARALKLPVKKEKGNVAAVAAENVEEVKESDESSRVFMEEFLSNWVLLHEDTWMMPVEILNWTKVIKEGNFEKVDWAGLIWFMLEKELLAAPQLGDCYYASHMQSLIKCQKEELLMEQQPVMVEEVDDVKEDEEEDDDVKMEPGLLEEHNIELSLGGQENVVKEDCEKEEEKEQEQEQEQEKEPVGNEGDEDVMDFEESKEEDEQHEQHEQHGQHGQHGQWLFEGGKSNEFDIFLRRCNQSDDVGGMDCEEERKEEEEGEEEEEDEEVHDEEEEEQDGGFHISLKGDTLERVTSANLIAAMEEVQIPFGSGVQIHDNSSGEFLASRVDTHMIPGGSSLFGNGNKRGIGHENDVSHNAMNGSNKRLRSHSSWDDKSSDFEMCMDQVQHWMEKARMMHAAKQQAYEESNMNQQILLNELQARNSMIDQLQNAKFEEQHKRAVEVRRLERELCMMGNLLESYRKALKETHKTFAEYRERCPVPDEPLYKDVAGSGGLVLSTMELERQRLKQEEEERMNRMLIEEKIKNFEDEWIGKFESHKDGVNLLGNKLLDVEKEVKLIKEWFAKQKNSDKSECAAPIEE